MLPINVKMAGLPCKVAIVLVLVLSGSEANLVYKCENPESPVVNQTPEKCYNKLDTGSHMSNEERQSAVNAVNLYRAFIARQCNKFKSGKPNPSRFLKIRYSCELEQSVKFECPAVNAKFETDNKVFRRTESVSSKSIFYRIAPWLNETSISGKTRDFDDPSVRGADTFRFYLNGNAPEIGCYLNICHGKKYLACTTQTDIPTSGSLYAWSVPCVESPWEKESPAGYNSCDYELGLCVKGEPCETEADCTDPVTPVCRGNQCREIECDNYGYTVIYPNSYKYNDPCHIRYFCYNSVFRNQTHHFCQSTVLIAERNDDGVFSVKGFGAAVSERYFLTSVSSEFSKFGTTDLYIIVKGTRFYQIRGSGVFPEMHIGHFDVNAWQDLVLVKLPDVSFFKFDQYLKIKEADPEPQFELESIFFKKDYFLFDNFDLKSDDQCSRMFYRDPTISYVKNSSMACGFNERYSDSPFLSGTPVGTLTDGEYTLYGIRSVAPLDPKIKMGYLVTKLAPNCDWLFMASAGTVKCI